MQQLLALATFSGRRRHAHRKPWTCFNILCLLINRCVDLIIPTCGCIVIRIRFCAQGELKTRKEKSISRAESRSNSPEFSGRLLSPMAQQRPIAPAPGYLIPAFQQTGTAILPLAGDRSAVSGGSARSGSSVGISGAIPFHAVTTRPTNSTTNITAVAVATVTGGINIYPPTNVGVSSAPFVPTVVTTAPAVKPITSAITNVATAVAAVSISSSAVLLDSRKQPVKTQNKLVYN